MQFLTNCTLWAYPRIIAQYWHMPYIYPKVFTLCHLRTLNNVQTDKTHNSQIDWHTDENLQNGRVSSHNSQIIRLSIDKFLNRKSQAHILQALEFRLCAQRDIKIPDHVYPTGAYLSEKNQYEINMFNCVISAIKCYFHLHRVPIFLSVLGLLKMSRKYITYTNEQTQKLVISKVFKAFLTQLVTFSKWQHKVYTKIFCYLRCFELFR